MSKFGEILTPIILAGLCIVLAAPTSAQQRRFVSGQGNDANPCSLAAPCRSFDAAIAAVNSGGEVVVLDSAGYGPFSVDKAVTVTASRGVYAGITVFPSPGNTPGITVAAGVDEVVVLRGLTLNSLGAPNGIFYFSGKTLIVENSVLSGFANRAIDQRTGELAVTDTVLRDNGFGAFIAASAIVHATFERVHLAGNNVGIRAHNNSQVVVRDSVVAGNHTGVDAFSASAAAELTIESCLVANNASTGIGSIGGFGAGLVRVSNTMVTNNRTGLLAATTNELVSRINNTVTGNTSDGVFTGTFPGL